MKLLPRNYATHLDVLVGRLREKARAQRAAEANARTPWQRTPPMSLERRMAGYLDQHFPPRARPSAPQLKRLMDKAGIIDPAVVLAAWENGRADSEMRHWDRERTAARRERSHIIVIHDEVAW